MSASNRPCKQCGTVFYGQGKFCSADCRGLGHNRGRPLGRQESLTCKRCGHIFEVPPSLKDVRQYCSVKCSHAAGTPKKAGKAGWRARSKYVKGKVDANHGEIVSAFVERGAQVFDTSGMGGGFPDLLVCARGWSHLVEVKNAKTSYGKRGLNPAQKEFAELWQGGPVWIIYTVDDVINFLAGDTASIQSFGGYKG